MLSHATVGIATCPDLTGNTCVLRFLLLLLLWPWLLPPPRRAQVSLLEEETLHGGEVSHFAQATTDLPAAAPLCSWRQTHACPADINRVWPRLEEPFSCERPHTAHSPNCELPLRISLFFSFHCFCKPLGVEVLCYVAKAPRYFPKSSPGV